MMTPVEIAEATKDMLINGFIEESGIKWVLIIIAVFIAIIIVTTITRYIVRKIKYKFKKRNP